MEIEHEVKVLPIDDKLQSEVQKLQKEGWEVAAGTLPVAVYHLVRIKRPAPPSAGAGMAQLSIDDTKVGILKADGTMR